MHIAGLVGCIEETCHADFALQMRIEDDTPQLLYCYNVRAGSFGDQKECRESAKFEGPYAAGSIQVIDIGQIMACHFNALLLVLQRALTEIQSAKQSKHRSLVVSN